LNGNLPSEIGNLVKCQNIDLSNNNFGGSVPNSWANLKKLKFLNLQQNNIQGRISSSIANLPSLSQLQVDPNNKPIIQQQPQVSIPPPVTTVQPVVTFVLPTEVVSSTPEITQSSDNSYTTTVYIPPPAFTQRAPTQTMMTTNPGTVNKATKASFVKILLLTLVFNLQ